MALLHIRSTNPKMSYALAKNPETGLLVKSMGYGHTFGFFPAGDEQTYTVYFKDNPNRVSFKKHKDEHIEFMNVSRFNSAVFVPAAIGDYFSSLYKGSTTEDATGFDNELEIPLVNLDAKSYLEIFPKYLPDFELVATPISDKNYNLKIKTKRSLSDLVNYTALFFVLNILRNKNDFFEGNEDQLIKYIDSMGRVNAPYFMRYVFKVNLMQSEKKFKEKKALLENVEGKNIDMVFGNTNDQRLKAVQERIFTNNVLVEIGCGEGNQTLKLAKKAAQNDLPYYAIDTDENIREVITKRLARKKLENVTVLESFEAFTLCIAAKEDAVADKAMDIICVEVIEHMEKAEATALIREVITFGKHYARTLVVTSPNADFNVNYGLDTEYRHDDHKFEFTEKEFREWVAEIGEVSKETPAEIFGIGDTVDGVVTTLGVQFFF